MPSFVVRRLAVWLGAFALVAVGAPAVAAAEDLPDAESAVEQTPAGGLVLSWQVQSDDGDNFSVAAELTNETESLVSGWAIELPNRHQLANASVLGLQDESAVTLSDLADLPPGRSESFDLQFTSNGPVSRIPATCSVVSSEAACRVVVPSTEDAGSEPVVEGADVLPEAETELQPEVDVEESTEELPESQEADEAQSAPESDDAEKPEVCKVSVTYRVISDWGTGQTVTVRVANEGNTPINTWHVAIPWQVAVTSIWNAESTSGGGVVRARNAAWNGALDPGQAVEFGFNAQPGATTTPEDGCVAATPHQTKCELHVVGSR